MQTDLAPTTPDFKVTGKWPRTLMVSMIAVAFGLGGFGLSLAFAGDAEAGRRLKFTYLTAYMFCLSFPLGGMFFVMIHHVTHAKWSVVVRRLGERIMMLMPLMAILFIPILFFMKDLYPWARPEVVMHDEVIQEKTAYLNVPFFIIRAVIYFAFWLGWSYWLRTLSLKHDRTGDPKLIGTMRAISAPGILLFALTITFASFDWMMSLEPHWYSTIFGVYYFAGSAVGILALLILVSMAALMSGDMGQAITKEHFHDMGKLLFGFVVFWAYISFSQLLLMWMANLPEETLWYYHRWASPGWKTFSYVLLFGHFVIPFLLLLPRTIKRFKLTLAAGAIWMLVAHWADMFYLVMGAYDPDNLPFSLRELFLGFALFCLMLSYLFWRLPKYPLAPTRDPHLAKSMAFENY